MPVCLSGCLPVWLSAFLVLSGTRQADYGRERHQNHAVVVLTANKPVTPIITTTIKRSVLECGVEGAGGWLEGFWPAPTPQDYHNSYNLPEKRRSRPGGSANWIRMIFCCWK